LIDWTKRSAWALQFGEKGGVRTVRTPARARIALKRAELGIAVADQEPVLAEEAVAVGEVQDQCPEPRLLY